MGLVGISARRARGQGGYDDAAAIPAPAEPRETQMSPRPMWKTAICPTSGHKTGRRAQTQYGISDVANRWDSWPSGFLYCAPLEETANGLLVLDVGDLLVMLGRYVEAPVSLHIENGRVVDVEGGVDAKLLRERLQSSGDADAFVISHIGWGTDPRALWTEVAERGTQEGARDARSVYGNVPIAFGANYALGGKNTTMAHEDLILRKANLCLDETEVVRDGVIVPDDLK